MKTTKRDWLNFTAGFATATIMALAVSDVIGATTESTAIDDDIKPHRITYEKDWNMLINNGFIEEIMSSENSIMKGWHRASQRWFPHASPEGGNDTIAYGHKLTNDDVRTNRFSNGITKGQAQRLLISDIQKSLDCMKLSAEDWNNLTWKQQWLLLDFQFNLGCSFKKFPKFTHAVLYLDKQRMLNEYKRYYKDSNGNRHEIKDRNKRTYKFITQNF